MGRTVFQQPASGSDAKTGGSLLQIGLGSFPVAVCCYCQIVERSKSMSVNDIVSFTLSLATAITTFLVMQYIGYAMFRYFNN